MPLAEEEKQATTCHLLAHDSASAVENARQAEWGQVNRRYHFLLLPLVHLGDSAGRLPSQPVSLEGKATLCQPPSPSLACPDRTRVIQQAVLLLLSGEA